MPFDPFCVKDEIDRSIFYSSKHFAVLYDIKPVVRGHCLFVPRRHMIDMRELNNEEIIDLHSVFGLVVPKILKLYGATENSYDLASQIGPYSGRTVSHLHIHMLPRSKDDEYQKDSSNIFEDIKMNRTNFSYVEVENEVKKLRKEFGFRLQQR